MVGPSWSAQPAADRMVRCSNPARDLGMFWETDGMCTEYVENCRHISYESYEPLRFLGAVNCSLGMTQPSWKKAAYLGRRQRTWKRNHLDLQKFNIFCCGLLYFWAVWTFPTKTHLLRVIFYHRALHEFPMPAEAPNFPSDPIWATFCWTIRQFRADLAMASQSSTDFDDLWWRDLHVLPTWPQQKKQILDIVESINPYIQESLILISARSAHYVISLA